MTNDEIFEIFSTSEGTLTRECAISAMKQARLDERFAMCHEIQGACMIGRLSDKYEDAIKILMNPNVV